MTTTAKPPRASAKTADHSGQHEHVVQFYESDDYLVGSLRDYIRAGLDAGEACVVVAAPAHREALEQRLTAEGVDVEAARTRGEYVALDAAATLARFLVDGAPDPERFVAVIGSVIAAAAQGERGQQRRVRVFGEMVALLWAQGRQEAAIRLEDLWNDLGESGHPFTLYCAYQMTGFAGDAYGAPFAAICDRHVRVIPDERYTALTSQEERLRAITLLQQKASALEAAVAEREAAQERLREAEGHFRAMAEWMPEKVFTARPDGAIEYRNPQWVLFAGPAPAESVEEWWRAIVHPDEAEETVAQWRQALATGEPFSCEHRFQGAAGIFRWHVSRAVPIRDAGGQITMWIGSSTDIDEQKQLEARKNAFISMASHELRTPVTSLKGFTQILQRRLDGQTDPQTEAFLRRMEAQINRLAGLIEDMLDVSKMLAGTLAFRKTRMDLDALVRETVENVQTAVTTHEICVEGETAAQVHGDRDRLEQVLVNLLTNAVKYSPNARRVAVRLSRASTHAQVAVQDFGIGIAKEHQARVFDQFYQASNVNESTYPGLGIGLYIARTLVEGHGGRLWLESSEGAGSTFYLTLPLAGAAGAWEDSDRSVGWEAVS